jgi:D-serine deaminase-like pyridoxal phosphate-dependent protein
LLVSAGVTRIASARAHTACQRVDYGYGAVCDAAGDRIDGFVLSGANQEHGILSRADGAVETNIAARFPVGTLLRALPNHACATGAQFDHYHAVAPDGAVQIWRRFHGW